MSADESMETVDCRLENTYLSQTMRDSINKQFSGSKVLDARALFLDQASKDGQFMVVTAVVQLLLEQQRQKRQTGSDVSSPAAEHPPLETASAAVQTHQTDRREAAEPHGKTCSLGSRKSESNLKAGDATCTRPANVPPGELKRTEKSSQNKPPRRSNKEIIRLAHTLAASHANPQLEGMEAAELPAFPMKKPAVPRASRQSIRSQSNTPIDHRSGNKGLTPLATMSAITPRKRPAWAQLSNAAPAEQEQALLDWVTAVEEPSLDLDNVEEAAEQGLRENYDVCEPVAIES